PLLALMVYMGLYPRPFLSRSRESVQAIRARVLPPSTGEFAEETRKQ
ncbi:MAG: hypothetical protein QOF61_2367, partial [Acidobacteriota bacterium]|nr:hypothetical protein [Acidobacteriota bacterium]